MSRAVVIKYNLAFLRAVLAGWHEEAQYRRDLRLRYHTMLHRTNQQVKVRLAHILCIAYCGWEQQSAVYSPQPGDNSFHNLHQCVCRMPNYFFSFTAAGLTGSHSITSAVCVLMCRSWQMPGSHGTSGSHSSVRVSCPTPVLLGTCATCCWARRGTHGGSTMHLHPQPSG